MSNYNPRVLWKTNKSIVKLYCDATGRKLSATETPSRRNLYRFRKWIEQNEKSVIRDCIINDIINE